MLRETRSNFSGFKQQDIMHEEGPSIINPRYLASLCITKHFKQLRRRLIMMVIQRTSLRGCNSALGGELRNSCTAAVNVFFFCLGLIRQVIKPIWRVLTLQEFFWCSVFFFFFRFFVCRNLVRTMRRRLLGNSEAIDLVNREVLGVCGADLHPRRASTCKPRPRHRVSWCRTAIHVEGLEMGARLALKGLSAEGWEHQTNIRPSLQIYSTMITRNDGYCSVIMAL